MTSQQIMPVFMLAVALASVTAVAGGEEENTYKARIEVSIPTSGASMAVGFKSLWVVSKDDLVRISLPDNSITNIPAPGLSTLAPGNVAIGKDAVWVPSSTTLYKIDPQKMQS